MIVALAALIAETLDRIATSLHVPNRIAFDPEETP